MLYLFHGGGASDFQLLSPPFSPEQWPRMRMAVCQLLKRRGQNQAASLLEEIPFDLLDATNVFNDEFAVLYTKVPFEQYFNLTERYEDAHGAWPFREIASAVSEVASHYVRFVAVELATDSGSSSIPAPALQTTSEAVERALADAEQLIGSRGPVSAIDRVHTAFHGYLRTAAAKSGIQSSDEATTVQLLKAIQGVLPELVGTGPRAEEIGRILRAMATILDTLNTLRNRASLAHPNQALLEDAEAMLVVNTVRTLMHYLNAKIR